MGRIIKPPTGITSWTHGYGHPNGECPHEPACYPDRTRCRPQPKQSFAHASIADVLFYGGAVGGGKSEFDLVEAITICLTHKGAKVAIFRRKLKELKQELVGRFLQLVPEWIASYNGSDMFARFHATGAELWFCHAQHEKDVYSYQSVQWLALFLDEASHFTEFQVRYLITRVRSAAIGRRKRIILTSNPGGVGHGWLKRWFIRPTPDELGGRPAPRPFEVWRPLPLPHDPTAPDDVPSRQFIPAWFKDNHALATADPHYLAKVYALGGDKAKQLAEGDWDANDSMITGPFWRERRQVQPTDHELIAYGFAPGQNIPWHVINDRQWRPPVGSNIFGSVDYGYGAPWSFHLHATLPGGHVRTFFEFYKARVRDAEQARMIAQALERETFADGKTPLMAGLQWMVMDPAMWNSRAEMGLSKSIAEVYQDALPRVQLQPGAAGRGARVSRPNRWMDALSTMDDGLPFWSVTTGCPDLIRTVPEVPWDEDDPDVEDGDSENHAYEDVGRFFEARPAPARVPEPDPYSRLDPISAAHQRAVHERLHQKHKGGIFVPPRG